MRKARKKGRKTPEGMKISKLMHEGKPQDQAVATALSMKRAGRLTKSGGYMRKGRKKSKRRGSKY